MAGKHKFGGIGAKGSARINFFNPSAPLREKYGEGHVNQEHFKNLTITGECQQVFSQWSKSKCAKYNVTHQDFPSITFQITKNNFPVKVEREAIFESKKATAVPQENVVPPPLVSEQSPNNQAIHLSRTHATSSVSGRLVFTVCHQRGNLDMADIADILALGLQIDNEDPRPENLPNAMLNTWIHPIICLCVQDANGQNLNGRFSKMSWGIIAEADELKLFKVITTFFDITV